jgi:gas vesicle protein
MKRLSEIKGGKMVRESGVSKAVLSFAVGLGVGAALGILFAPRSGEETRDYLVGGAQDVADNLLTTARDAADDAFSRGRKFTRRAKQTLDDVAEQVKGAADEGERAYTRAKGA